MAQRRGHGSDCTACTGQVGVRGQWERQLAGEQSEHCQELVLRASIRQESQACHVLSKVLNCLEYFIVLRSTDTE